jgi:hypothetical protein
MPHAKNKEISYRKKLRSNMSIFFLKRYSNDGFLLFKVRITRNL